jgi:hypothetical protein
MTTSTFLSLLVCVVGFSVPETVFGKDKEKDKEKDRDRDRGRDRNVSVSTSSGSHFGRYRGYDSRHDHPYGRSYYNRYPYPRSFYGRTPYGYGPYGYGPYGYSHGYGYGSYGYGSYGFPQSSGVVVYRSYQPAPTVVYRGYQVDSGSDTLAMDVQRALRRRGYYHSSIDGDIGPGTRQAIRSYQIKNRLPVTGRIDSSLLRSLDLQ